MMGQTWNYLIKKKKKKRCGQLLIFFVTFTSRGIMSFFFGIIIYTLKIFVVQNSCNGGTKNPYVGSQFIGGEN